MSNPFATEDGRIILIAGKSRSGKSSYTWERVKGEPRLIAWDTQDQWAALPGWKRVTDQREFSAALVKAGRGPCKIAYVHPAGAGDVKENFDKWCRKVLAFGKATGPLVCIPDELSTVTTTSKAPEGWGDLARTGLKFGITMYPISQRWAESDKTAFNNVSEIVFFSMMPMDVKYMAERTGIAPEELAKLKKTETATTVTLPYIRLDVDTMQITRDKLQFRKKKQK